MVLLRVKTLKDVVKSAAIDCRTFSVLTVSESRFYRNDEFRRPNTVKLWHQSSDGSCLGCYTLRERHIASHRRFHTTAHHPAAHFISALTPHPGQPFLSPSSPNTVVSLNMSRRSSETSLAQGNVPESERKLSPWFSFWTVHQLFTILISFKDWS